MERATDMKTFFRLYFTIVVCTALAGRILIEIMNDYHLLVIEDDSVPMANMPDGVNYILIIGCILVVTMVVSIGIGYLVRRQRMVQRLLEVREANQTADRKIPLSLKQIKDEINENEFVLTGKIV